MDTSRGKRSKIGVLTFHRCINYGSYWQARCLIDWLRDHGLEAVLIDHESRRVSFAEFKCALDPSLPTPAPRKDRPYYREKIKKFYSSFENLPRSDRLTLERPELMDEFDLVIVGSDEVWNLSHPWYGRYELFFGKGVRARRLISYAASFGNYDAWAGLDDERANHLRGFEAISVRDDNSRTLIRSVLGVDPVKVLDPCLLHPPEIHFEGSSRKDPYIAVYGHNFSFEFADSVSRWAKRQQLETVSIGYRNDWADVQLLSADPNEFAELISGSDGVATNFFHGCVFALNNKRPLVCEAASYRNNKIVDLLSTLGCEERLMRLPSEPAVAECLSSPPNIGEKVKDLRRQSEAFLLSNV